MLEGVRGFVFDLDGCVWNGNTLNPGARETLTRLVATGRRIAFLTNNSRATADDILARLHALGVEVAEHAFTPLEIIGAVITGRFGSSRVLVIGAPEMAVMIARAGHTVIDVKDYRQATVVAVGNDFDLTYERLTAACRAAARCGRLVTPNVDPRLPIEGGDFLPGCGTLVAAVVAASGVTPVVVGKPEPPLFCMALERLGLRRGEAAMVGDSVPSDIRGARAVGMRTVLYAPDGGVSSAEADVTIRSFAILAVWLIFELAGSRASPARSVPLTRRAFLACHLSPARHSACVTRRKSLRNHVDPRLALPLLNDRCSHDGQGGRA